MQETPLYPVYQKYHAKVVDFHGWALPVQFNSIIQEHLAVREQAGLFDVSHMGEFLISGADALNFLEFMLTNRIDTLKPGFIRYSPLCLETGGTIDDLLVYRLSEQEFLLVVNASNIEKDFQWLQNHSGNFHLKLENNSNRTAQLALQGPRALTILERLTDFPINTLKYYQFAPEIDVAGYRTLLSRTGYTGEDGFEIYLNPRDAIGLWEAILECGAPEQVVPVGLGARDTLRLEAALPLYGQELSETITPLEAGLERFVKMEKDDFLGKTAFQKIIREGLSRRLVGIELVERGIPRSDCQIFRQGRNVGYITSGSYCPALAKNLGMALISQEYAAIGQPIEVDIRGKLIKAEITGLPFYTRPKGAAQ